MILGDDSNAAGHRQPDSSSSINKYYAREGPSIMSFDVTIPMDKAGTDHIQVGKRLAEIFKKFVFQAELADTGYKHYQVRGQTYKRMYFGVFMTVHAKHLWDGHISRTCTSVHNTRSFNYVMKLDGRIGGPWKDDQFSLAALPVLTRQLQDFMSRELYQWQRVVEMLVKEIDDRRIILLHDAVGNIGKSIFTEYLEYKGLAIEIPPFMTLQDLMAAVEAARDKKAFVIDMPRSMPQHLMAEFFAGIESIKNGLSYDKRYHMKKSRFDRPQVLVFTNVMPFFGHLTADRWHIYSMRRDMTMVRMNIPEAIKLSIKLKKIQMLKKEAMDQEIEEEDVHIDDDPLVGTGPPPPPNEPGPLHQAFRFGGDADHAAGMYAAADQDEDTLVEDTFFDDASVLIEEAFLSRT